MTGYPKFFQSAEKHKKALWGTSVITFFSVLPLLILPAADALRRSVYGPPREIPCPAVVPEPITLWDTISSGQLFMYSFAFFGSLLWMLLQEYKSDKTIPHKLAYASLISTICFFCMLVYGASPDLRQTLPVWAVYFSILCFAIFMVIHYILLVYPTLPVKSLHDDMNAGANKLSAALDAGGEQE